MKKSIVIGRQFGSGGFDLGKRIAEELGYPFYDKEIVELAAEKGNFHQDVINKIDESAKGSFLYSIAIGNYPMGTMGGPLHCDLPINDKLFMTQSDIIKEIASKEPCVFVGRGADYVLKNAGIPHLSVFLYADMDYKIKRVSERLGISEQKAKEKIVKTEKQRRSYYEYYTNRNWGTLDNYDLCLNTGVISEEDCLEIIKGIVGKE